MVNRFLSSFFVISLAFTTSGCSFIHVLSSTNAPQENNPTISAQASFKIRTHRTASNLDISCSNPKKQEDVLVLLALSGGGSRAAYFSALSMLELQKIEIDIPNKGKTNLLNEVDVISSVSGGSLAAAYYVISGDIKCPSYSGRMWEEAEVRNLMTNDYLSRWIGNWFWPTNMVKYWLTDFDRTDVMAQTLADNMYDQKISSYRSTPLLPYGTVLDNDISFEQLNPLRPNLILNSTRGSWSSHNGEGIKFGNPFTFTAEDFGEISSSIDSYKVAPAVMASATFPGVFNFMTLKDFKNKEYLHIFDGGNSDNLGLTSLKRVIWESIDIDNELPRLKQKKIIVILVDSFTKPKGANPKDSDPRNGISFVVDTNFLDSTDSLLSANRDSLLFDYKNGKLFPFGEKQGFSDPCTKFFHWYSEDKQQKICSKEKGWWTSLNEDIQSKLKFIHLSFDDAGDFYKKWEEPAGDYTAEDYDEFSKNGGRWVMPEQDILRKQLDNIPTNFKFSSNKYGKTQLKDDEAISCAVPTFFGKEQICTNKKGQVVGTAKPKNSYKNEFPDAIEILKNPDSKFKN